MDISPRTSLALIVGFSVLGLLIHGITKPEKSPMEYMREQISDLKAQLDLAFPPPPHNATYYTIQLSSEDVGCGVSNGIILREDPNHSKYINTGRGSIEIKWIPAEENSTLSEEGRSLLVGTNREWKPIDVPLPGRICLRSLGGPLMIALSSVYTGPR